MSAKMVRPESYQRATQRAAVEAVRVETAAEAYLTLLGERGIDYLFGNGGTDFASIIDALAHLEATGRKAPRPITVPHETVAGSMAHGFYLVTGRPQLVMVHVTVGTANLLAAVMNASRSRVPVIFSAGRTPITEKGSPASRNVHIHWAQESFDQASIVREWVKWDYELRDLAQLETVVDRALSVAMAEPRGPVYLSLPREVLAQRCESFSFRKMPSALAPELAHERPEGLEEAANALAQAKNPLIVAGAAGAFPGTVAELIRIADTAAIPVVEAPGRNFCNFPTTHPMHVGFNSHELIKEADVILVVESGTPWLPAIGEPAPGATVISVGMDPLQLRHPIWGYPVDVPIVCNSRAALAALNSELGERLREQATEVGERRQRWTQLHERQRAVWRAHADVVKGDRPIDPAWVSRCISDVKSADTICLNEYDLSPLQTEFTEQGTYFGPPSAGGLGWALGAALGAKLGAPERTVICAVGDGSYIFGAPSAAHFVARAQNLPVLFVIFNNQCWGSVKESNRTLHPEGWAARNQNYPLCDLRPSPDYEKIVEAFGGYGEKVEDPAEMRSALERALRAVREEKRQAVLNVICKYPQ